MQSLKEGYHKFINLVVEHLHKYYKNY